MKIFTLKFYGETRHNETACLQIYQEIIDKHDITNILRFHDSESNVGYHINGVFHFDHYIKLLKLYKIKSPQKDKRVFWWMQDATEKETINWLKYCILRENQYKNRSFLD